MLLVFIEFFVPGGLLAVVGGLLIVIGVTTFSALSIPFAIKAIFFVSACGLTAALCSFALFLIRRKGKHNLQLRDDQGGVTAASMEQPQNGATGIALSDLKPSGFVLIKGKRYQAISEGLYLQKGDTVEVKEGRGATLIVTPQKKEETYAHRS